MNTWRIRLGERAVLGVTVRLVLGVLVAVGGLLLPVTAHAQTKRLEYFINYYNTYYHQYSDDGGYTWSGWVQVPSANYTAHGAPLMYYSFVGPVSVTSDRPGHLVLAAKTTDNEILANEYSGGTWTGWYAATYTDGSRMDWHPPLFRLLVLGRRISLVCLERRFVPSAHELGTWTAAPVHQCDQG
jgi:hypothetical protein